MSDQPTLFPVAPGPPPIANPASVIFDDEYGEFAWVLVVPGHTDTADRAKAYLLAEYPNVRGWTLDPSCVYPTDPAPAWCQMADERSEDEYAFNFLPTRGWRRYLRVLLYRRRARCWQFDISTAAYPPGSESEREWRISAA